MAMTPAEPVTAAGGGSNNNNLHHRKPTFNSATTNKGKKDDGDDDFEVDNASEDTTGRHHVSLSGPKLSGCSQKRRAPWSFLRSMDTEFAQSAVVAGLPSLGKICLQTLGVATIALYVLNQKHCLPKPVGQWVSKILFWPTLPITVSRRIGKWTTVVDETVLIGGAPFGFLGYPERLTEKYGVKGVINMCDEYQGPVSSYRRLGIEQLRLPTVDHFEPSVEDLKRAVSFIQKHESLGGKVYVHCRAGHGRSAAAVFAWLLYKEPLADPIDLNEKFCAMRDVRKSLWKQPNVNTFRVWLQNGGMMDDSDSDEDVHYSSKRYRTGSSDNIIRPDTGSSSRRRRQKMDRRQFFDSSSDIETDSSSDEYSDDDIRVENTNRGAPSSSLGKVFSDEDESTEGYTDGGEVNDNAEYDDDYSEDEKDYAMWKNYRKD